MLQFIVFLVIAFLAYKYIHGWYGVGGAVVLCTLYLSIAPWLRSKVSRRKTDALLHRSLSEEERLHFGEHADHQRVMETHKAQFDPELRKKLGRQ